MLNCILMWVAEVEANPNPPPATTVCVCWGGGGDYYVGNILNNAPEMP